MQSIRALVAFVSRNHNLNTLVIHARDEWEDLHYAVALFLLCLSVVLASSPILYTNLKRQGWGKQH